MASICGVSAGASDQPANFGGDHVGVFACGGLLRFRLFRLFGLSPYVIKVDAYVRCLIVKINRRVRSKPIF